MVVQALDQAQEADTHQALEMVVQALDQAQEVLVLEVQAQEEVHHLLKYPHHKQNQ